MYTIGMQAVAFAFRGTGWTLPVVAALFVLAFILWVLQSVANTERHPDEPTHLPSTCFFSMRAFYGRRFDFLNWGFRSSGQPIYQFNLLQVALIITFHVCNQTNIVT
jgi:hypothetical protein